MTNRLEGLASLFNGAGQFALLAFDFLRLLFTLELLFAEALFLVDHAFELLVDEGLPFHQAFFGFGGSVAAGGQGLFGFFSELEGFLARLEVSLARDIVGLAAGILQDGLFLDGKSGLESAVFPAQQRIAEKGPSG